MEKIYDVIIVGGGPAGLTAGLYTESKIIYIGNRKSWNGKFIYGS